MNWRVCDARAPHPPPLRAHPAMRGPDDHGGNVSAQIAYGTTHKTRWVYPAWYYNVTQHIEARGRGQRARGQRRFERLRPQVWRGG